jgi:hypothetical protein
VIASQSEAQPSHRSWSTAARIRAISQQWSAFSFFADC